MSENSRARSSARDRARALLADATPGPWKCCAASKSRCQCGLVWAGGEYAVATTVTTGASDYVLTEEQRADNAALIAAAPELLTALCDELDRAEAKVARLREALRPFAEACIDGELGDAFISAGLDEAVMAARAALEALPPVRARR